MPLALLLLVAAAAPAPAPPAFRALEDGLELATFDVTQPSGKATLTVLRADPKQFELTLAMASAADGTPRTARAWADRDGLVAAINSSMFQTDHRTSVSLLRLGAHANNPRLTADKAILVFDPTQPTHPAWQLLDTTCGDVSTTLRAYAGAVQSIRMLGCQGRNTWTQGARRWSTAATAVDAQGRVLFVHSRAPLSPHDFVEAVRALPLGVTGMLYGEGGPEAQLFVRSGETVLERVGSFETGFNENDLNTRAWPVPNVLGLKRRAR